MDIRDIISFNTLAEVLNVTKAADKLYISQPALSRTIISLEKELGGTLFVRDRKNPHLTQYGQSVYESTLKIQKEYERLLDKRELFSRSNAKSVRVGIMSSEVSITNQLKDGIRSLITNHPDTHIDLIENSFISLQNAFEVDALDMLVFDHLLNSPIEVPNKNYKQLLLSEYQQCIVVHNTHQLAGRKSISVNEIANERFVFMHRAKFPYSNKFYADFFARANFVPQTAATVDSVLSLLSYISCNVGVAVLSEVAKAIAPNDVVFIPLEGETVKAYARWKGDNENPALKQFVKELKKTTNQ